MMAALITRIPRRRGIKAASCPKAFRRERGDPLESPDLGAHHRDIVVSPVCLGKLDHPLGRPAQRLFGVDDAHYLLLVTGSHSPSVQSIRISPSSSLTCVGGSISGASPRLAT